MQCKKMSEDINVLVLSNAELITLAETLSHYVLNVQPTHDKKKMAMKIVKTINTAEDVK